MNDFAKGQNASGIKHALSGKSVGMVNWVIYFSRIVARHYIGVGKATTHGMTWALANIDCGQSWHAKITLYGHMRED